MNSGGTGSGQEVPKPPSRSRTEVGRFAELAALMGFAVVSPVLGSFGESAETFVAVGATSGNIVGFGFLVAFAPLVVLGLLAAATNVFGPRVRATVQHALVGLLTAAVAATLVRRADVGSAARWLAAGVVGAGAVWLHRWWRPGQLFLRYASPAPVLFLLIFLFASPVHSLVDPAEVDIEQAAAGNRPPVVVIVLDELPTTSIVARGGRVDTALFPNLARLAARSTWYRNNTSVAPDTNVALRPW